MALSPSKIKFPVFFTSKIRYTYFFLIPVALLTRLDLKALGLTGCLWFQIIKNQKNITTTNLKPLTPQPVV